MEIEKNLVEGTEGVGGGDLSRMVGKMAGMDPEMVLDHMANLEEDDPEAAKVLRHGAYLPMLCQNDKGWVGLSAFYELIRGDPPPRHVLAWMKEREIALEEGKRGIMLKAFRGATKSTTLSFLAPLFDLGHNPLSSTLIIRLKDKVAHKLTENMGRVILSEEWKRVFPNVVPHEGEGAMKRGGGWGAAGYNVWDKSYGVASRFDMIRQRDTLDPSFLGVGIGSGEIIGKHPTGNLVVDDVHNRDNTESLVELERVKDIFVADVFPTIIPRKTVVSWAYTPWVEHDAYALAEHTGQYRRLMTPAYVELPEPGLNTVDYDGEYLTMRNAVLTWPEIFTPEELEIKLRESNDKDFARMYQLNLEKAKGTYLSREWLGEYPVNNLNANFPVVFGVDYASTKERRSVKDFNYFAVAVGVLLPMGGVVLVDGIRKKLSQAEAEIELLALARKWHPRMIGVEDVGSGSEFIKIVRRSTALPVMPFSAKGMSKAARFETEMAPMFQFNRAYVSSHHTPFIQLFINAWVSWDRTGTTPDDELDAVYYMLRAGADKLMGTPTEGYNFVNPYEQLEQGITTISGGLRPHFGRK